EGVGGSGKIALRPGAGELGASAGLRVLRARGGELEREFPYGLVRQLFEPVLVEADHGEVECALSGAAAAARPLLVSGRTIAMPAIGDTSFALLHGLYWLTA